VEKFWHKNVISNLWGHVFTFLYINTKLIIYLSYECSTLNLVLFIIIKLVAQLLTAKYHANYLTGVREGVRAGVREDVRVGV